MTLLNLPHVSITNNSSQYTLYVHATYVMEIVVKDMANDNKHNFCLLTLQILTIKCFFQLKDIQYTGPVFYFTECIS